MTAWVSWAWRAAVLALLAWIAAQLHAIAGRMPDGISPDTERDIAALRQKLAPADPREYLPGPFDPRNFPPQ